MTVFTQPPKEDNEHENNYKDSANKAYQKPFLIASATSTTSTASMLMVMPHFNLPRKPKWFSWSDSPYTFQKSPGRAARFGSRGLRQSYRAF